jgi:dsRNA-specific ribonuclease
MEDYRAHLSNVFALFINDSQIQLHNEVKLAEGESLVDHILLSEENMEDYWWPAVTHISYDFHPERNWENLELLGDGYADSAFTRFFMAKYPNQTQLFYSETRNYYLGNEYIAEITRDTLRLGNFIRIKGIANPTNSMFADCFESFCGALIRAGDRHFLGFGLVLIEYFINYIFRDIDVNDVVERTYGKSVTQLEQIMGRIGIEKIKFKVEVDNYIYKYEYYLTREQIEGLNKLLIGKQIKVTNRLVIGKSEGRGKSEMKDLAADNAFNFLKGYGINTPWSQNIKNQRDLTIPSLKKLASEAMSKARKAGYISISFREVDKSDTDDFIIIILLGVRKGGVQESLDVIAVDKQVDRLQRNVVIKNGHKEILEHYLAAN